MQSSVLGKEPQIKKMNRYNKVLACFHGMLSWQLWAVAKEGETKRRKLSWELSVQTHKPSCHRASVFNIHQQISMLDGAILWTWVNSQLYKR